MFSVKSITEGSMKVIAIEVKVNKYDTKEILRMGNLHVLELMWITSMKMVK